MAYRAVKNIKHQNVLLHFTANDTVVIAGNNSVSNVAVGDEVLTGAYISQVYCGSASGNGAYWTIKRNANVVGVYDSTAHIDYAGFGMSLTLDPAANVVVTLHNATDNEGYLMIELQKKFT